MLEDVLKTNDEHIIQKYLEENPLILTMSIGVSDWVFNYALPQFKLGSKYIADFIVLSGQSNSYEITIVEIKTPEARLYNKDGTLAKDFNRACTQVQDYRNWIWDNKDEFKRNLVEAIKKQDSSFEDDFSWTRRLSVNSAIIIGRRANITSEQHDRNADLKDLGVSVVSFDRLIINERRIIEMKKKGIDLHFFSNDYWIKEKYGQTLTNKEAELESYGHDNPLFMGDEEKEYGKYGFYSDILEREEKSKKSDS